jgi:hypothetical protein
MSGARGWGTALLAVVLAAVLLAAGLLAVSWLFAETRRDTRTVEAIAGVDVRLEAGNVELIGSARADVAVELVRTSSPLYQPQVSVRRDGERLLIISECTKPLRLFGVGTCRADLRLFLPATLSTVVHTQRGTVASTAMQAGIRLTTDRGPVRIAGQSGDLQVNTLEGSVEVRDLAAGTADLRARDGGINVVVSTPGSTLSLRTDGSDIVVAVPPGNYAVDANTEGGELTLAEGIANDPGSASVIRIRTAGGDFRASLPAGASPPAN